MNCRFYAVALLCATSYTNLLWAETVEFSRKAEFKRPIHDIEAILLAFDQTCEKGCLYPEAKLKESRILQQSATDLLVWTHYAEIVPIQTYKVIQIERTDAAHVTLSMQYPPADQVEELTKVHGLPHKTSLDHESQIWVLQESQGADGQQVTTAEIKASFSGAILQGAVAKILSRTFNDRIDARFKLLETAGLPRAVEDINYYTHVKPIMDAHCVGCHQSGGLAPFALDNYDQVKRLGKTIIAAIASGRMPPSAPNPVPAHPLKYDFAVGPTKLELLQQWVDAGSPEGNISMPGAPIHKERPVISRVDQTLGMEKAYTIQAGVQDEYRCFVMGEATAEEFFITGYRVRSTNTTVVHHVGLFAFDPEYAGLVSEMDATDASPGYSCFGAPSAAGFENLPARLIGVSTLPAANFIYPEKTGVQIKPGTRFVLQMHYSLHTSHQGTSHEDQTSIDLQVEKSVAKPLLTPFFTKHEWVMNDEMKIPAGEKEVIHGFSQNPMKNTSFLWSKGDMTFPNGIFLYGIYPHQHLLGKGLRFWKEDRQGNKEMLFDNWGNYSFHFQWNFEFEKPVHIAPGEKLGLECLWDNSPENQPGYHGRPAEPKDTGWGEGSNDEMCVAMIAVAES